MRINSEPLDDIIPPPNLSVSKGFGKPKAKVEKESEPKDAGTLTYEAQQKRGIPEYNVFIRPVNGTEGGNRGLSTHSGDQLI